MRQLLCMIWYWVDCQLTVAVTCAAVRLNTQSFYYTIQLGTTAGWTCHLLVGSSLPACILNRQPLKIAMLGLIRKKHIILIYANWFLFCEFHSSGYARSCYARRCQDQASKDLVWDAQSGYTNNNTSQSLGWSWYTWSSRNWIWSWIRCAERIRKVEGQEAGSELPKFTPLLIMCKTWVTESRVEIGPEHLQIEIYEAMRNLMTLPGLKKIPGHKDNLFYTALWKLARDYQ